MAREERGKRIIIIRHLAAKLQREEKPEDDRYYIDEAGEGVCDGSVERLIFHGVDPEKAVILYAEAFPRASLTGIMFSEKTGIRRVVTGGNCDFYDKRVGEKGSLTLAQKEVRVHHESVDDIIIICHSDFIAAFPSYVLKDQSIPVCELENGHGCVINLTKKTVEPL